MCLGAEEIAGRDSHPSLGFSVELNSNLSTAFKKVGCSGKCTNICWGVLSVTFMEINSTWRILGEVNKYEDDIIHVLCKDFSKKPLKNYMKAF